MSHCNPHIIIHTNTSKQNFFVVMIIPIIINKLQWKAYLNFMATNFAFVPLVYFCYPETANLTLEEIDNLYIKSDKSAVKISKELQKERRLAGHQRKSIVADTGIARRMSSASGGYQEKNVNGGHIEQA